MDFGGKYRIKQKSTKKRCHASQKSAQPTHNPLFYPEERGKRGEKQNGRKQAGNKEKTNKKKTRNKTTKSENKEEKHLFLKKVDNN